MAEEGIVIEGESEGSSQAPIRIEEKAREKGWKPREESDLPEEQWVDAREFLGRQPLFDQIHSLKRELTKQNQRFSQEMNQISEHFAKMQQVEYDKAIKQLKAEKKVAIENQDLVSLEEINDEIKEKEKEREVLKQAAPKPQQANNTQELDAWRGENKWFDEDKELQREAIALGTGYAMSNPSLTQTDVLDYVSKRIKKIYPEKFEIKQQRTIVTDNKVEAGGITGNSGLGEKKPKGLSKGDLNDQELSVMKTLLKQNVLKAKAEKNKVTQEQQYLNDLAEAKGLR